MPHSSPKLSYEGFLEIVSLFTNGLNKLAEDKWFSPTNVEEIITNIPKEKNCEIFSFDFRKGELNFTDIKKPLDPPQKVCIESYNDILETIWQESVYLMVGRAPTYYLPFKSIAEQAIKDLSTIVEASSVIRIKEMQGMMLEYMLDADRVAEAAEKFGFFKSSMPKKSIEIDSCLVPLEVKQSI